MTRYTIHPSLVTRDEENELLLFNKETEEIKVMNEVGSSILKLCDGTNSVEEIIDKISVLYPQVPRELISQDVDRFVDLLYSKKIIITREA